MATDQLFPERPPTEVILAGVCVVAEDRPDSKAQEEAGRMLRRVPGKQPTDQAIIDRLVKLLKGHQEVRAAYLFGSRARGAVRDRRVMSTSPSRLLPQLQPGMRLISRSSWQPSLECQSRSLTWLALARTLSRRCIERE